MFRYRIIQSRFKAGIVAALLVLTSSLAAQNASQLGFTDLQSRANALVERGQLLEAQPFLLELVERVRASEEAEIELDFPYFLIGTSFIQSFVQSGAAADLEQTLKWYAALESEYPESERLKDALLKKVDVLRILQRDDAVASLIRKLLGGDYPFRLTYSEQVKLLRDLTQTYYANDQLEEGLPFFGQLLETSREFEDRALAAAASFEALLAQDRLDEAMGLLPLLAKDSEIRYRPRLNVALLKASDVMVERERLTDAALLLNLIKTTDVMIAFYEARLERAQRQLEQRQAFGGAADEVERLEQEIQTIERNLEQMRQLPTLRNELLVRRARNYTKTGRRYEAFWMFYDLMRENPDSDRHEFYTYAAFSNALQIEKDNVVLEIGRRYRSRYPEGDYYSDVSSAFIGMLPEMGKDEEFVQAAEEFLTLRNLDPAAASIYARYAGHLAEKEAFEKLLAQSKEWLEMHRSSTFDDGLHYWQGIALLQLGRFGESAARFAELVNRFPNSAYAEDGLLRQGVSLFYAQDFDGARETLYAYRDDYPKGDSLDQAYYFLGELEAMAGNYSLALEHLNQSRSLATSQDVIDGASFKIGSVLKTLGRFEAMANHFETYMAEYPESGRFIDAVFQLGTAYEALIRPNEMLQLFRESIEAYAPAEGNRGVDTLIEAYAEKYETNRKMLERTVAFLDRLEQEQDFRRKIVSDRGFLFEHFYTNQEIDQSLYNRMRNHPEFGPGLADGLEPIAELLDPYRQQLSDFTSEKPETFFKRLLERFRAADDFLAETRMLMGLYRSGIEERPSAAFTKDFFSRATPRVLLYIADYARAENRQLAVDAWNTILIDYPDSDSSIVAYMRLADVSAQRGDRSAAIDFLQAIRNRFPGSPKIPSVILRQGELLTEMGRFDEARSEYQYILRVPDWRGIIHARALYQIGQSYMSEGAFSEAHGFFERTFLGYSHFAEWAGRAYLADAEALLAMGSREDAVRTLEEAVERIAPDAPAELVESIRAKLKEIRS